MSGWVHPAIRSIHSPAMSTIDAAALLWMTRLVEQRKDLERMRWLAEHMATAAGATNHALWVDYQKLLGERFAELERLLENSPGLTVSQRWEEFAGQVSAGQRAVQLELEFLGGAALADAGEGKVAAHLAGLQPGFLKLASDWLNNLIAAANLGGPAHLVIGQAADLEADVRGWVHPAIRPVRVPFLDWDLWHLPLLGRQLGLLVAARDPGGHLAGLLPDLHAATETSLDSSTASLNPAQIHTHLRYLLADLLATALLGPAYALAVFALELDFVAPQALGASSATRQPGGGERMSTSERSACLPSAAQRAAAILQGLSLAQDERPRQSWEKGVYQAILGELKQLWETTRAALDSSPDQALSQAVAAQGALIRRLYLEGVCKILPPEQRLKTLAAWETASQVYQGKTNLNTTPPDLLELLSLLWLQRLDAPDGFKCQAVLEMAEAVALKGAAWKVNFKPQRAPNVLLRARVQRLNQRMERTLALLLENQGGILSGKLVAGRFYQGLSNLQYRLDGVRGNLASGSLGLETWKAVQSTEQLFRDLGREAGEFLAGAWLRIDELDREPKEVGRAGKPGPSLCALADRMFSDYAQRSGIHWNALTVPGIASFVARKTEIIRVEFPDWSLWNLPVMAHEFGHLVGFATAEFQSFQQEQRETLGKNNPRVRHLDEFFADLFAVYTLGPAFAACAILLQFNPIDAYTPSDSHPTHAERVVVILDCLRRMSSSAMNSQAQAGQPDYDWLIRSLEQAWSQSIAQCGLSAGASSTRLVEAWGGKIFAILERNYRVGVAYRLEQWRLAEQAAKEILDPLQLKTYPKLADFEQLVIDLGRLPRGGGFYDIWIGDLLNALWISRLKIMEHVQAQGLSWQTYSNNLEKLNASAVLLGAEYLARDL